MLFRSLSAPQSKIDEIDYDAVVDYFNLSAVPTPKTIYKKVRKLPPGHFLVIKKDELSPHISKYYDIEYPEKRADEDYFVKKLRLCIEDSVKTSLEYELSRGNRVGAFLSGGTDSSTVTGMIKKLNGHVKTFSIGFDEPGYNELEYARITSKHFGSEHYEYIVTPDDVLKAVDIIIDAYDEPFGNASAVPTYFCSLLAKENGVDTLFAGDGGDELFAGNARYVEMMRYEAYGRIPWVLRKGLIEPFRTPGGTRRYSDDDLERLGLIQELTAEGVNLEGVRRILSLQSENTRLRGQVERLRRLLGEAQARLDAEQSGTRILQVSVRRNLPDIRRGDPFG